MEAVNFSATERATVSEAEPGAKGTTTLTGFDGYTCAIDAPVKVREKNRKELQSSLINLITLKVKS
jgi:hypothetical protein